MKIPEKNILNIMHNNHRILIDEIANDGKPAARVCTVIRYIYDDEANSLDECVTATPMPFKVSPYNSAAEIAGKAIEWIDCCDCEEYNVNYDWIMFDPPRS